MASLPIHWIIARAYCQATEEEDRVAQALETAVPGGRDSRSRLEGQFGNAVVVITRRLEGSESLRDAWERLRSAGIFQAVLADLERRLDEDGVLHFRIDKQSAFAGNLALANGTDPVDVQVKLKAYPAKPEEILKVARRVLEAGS